MYRRENSSWLKHLDFLILDILMLQLSFVLAFRIRQGSWELYQDENYFHLNIFLVLSDIVSILMLDTLRNVVKRGYWREYVATLEHVCVEVLLAVFYLFLIKDAGATSRIIVLSMAGFYLVFSYGTRVLWKLWLRRKMKDGDGDRALLVLTVKDRLALVCHNLQEHNYQMFRIVGIVVMDEDMNGSTAEDFPIVASAETVAEFICRNWVDEVLFDYPDGLACPEDLVHQCEEMGVVQHKRVAQLPTSGGTQQFTEPLGPYTVLTTTLHATSTRQLICKRLLDILGGIVGCFITLILMVIIGPIIFIQSPGNIFFSQIRIGKNGRRFKIYKFRSMYPDAEERKKELMEKNRIKDGMMFKLDFDPRIIGAKMLPDGTVKKGIGNRIRDCSLDEFPQFWNVLKGDMSLVGTRPPTEDEWERYALHHRARMAAKPGITGLWQVSGRSDITDFEAVVELDREYISGWNIGMDIKILLKTVLVVLRRDGSM